MLLRLSRCVVVTVLTILHAPRVILLGLATGAYCDAVEVGRHPRGDGGSRASSDPCWAGG